MDVAEAIRHRRSIHHYLPDPVSPVEIREMLSLATMAPSIANRQMWRFIVISDANLLKMLAHLVERRIDEMAKWPEFDGQSQRIRAWKENALPFASAPAVILVINQGYRTPLDTMLIERGMKFWEVNDMFAYPDIQSIGGLIAFFSLLAEERGYGTCWITDTLVARKDLHASLGIKAGEQLCAMVTLGKPAEYPAPKARKSIDELIEWR